MAKVIVVGGAGYIGSHCCKALAAAGHHPVVFDNLSTGHRDFVRWGQLVKGDVRDQSALVQTMQEHRPDAIMHFASLISVGDSVIFPERFYDVNIGGTLALLEAMRQVGITSLIFSSTAAVYGEPKEVPIAEIAELKPTNPYGNTKLACERMMEDFDAAHGIRSIRFRYFNAAGAHPDADIGEHHDPETHLIPLVLDAALGRRESIKIYGTDYPTSDGTAIRDYVHVTDIASAHIMAMEYLLDGGKSLALNLGTGRGASVRHVIETASKIVNKRIPTEEAPRRSGDGPTLIADPGKALDVLGWHATNHDLASIISDAWRWHQLQFSTKLN